MSTRSPWLQVNIELYEACEELLERISPTEHCSAGGIAEYVNLIFHSGMEARLDEIGRRQTQLRRPD